MLRIARALLVVLTLGSMCPALSAGELFPGWRTPEGARQLVRRAVANELRTGHDNQRFRFRVTTTKPGLVQVREKIETDEGVVARLISVNGQPLTSQQQAAEDARLQKLLHDPQAWAKKRKEQQDDDARTQRMLQALPDAFIFHYEGTEPGPSGELIRLQFSPDPNYNPASRETQVYQGMRGEIWIDRSDLHLVRIDGTLFKGVNFGWGVLGHLDKGGHFLVEQSRLGPGRWDVTHEILQFTGKELFFFKLNIHEEEVSSDFRPVPQHLSLKDGISLLERPATVAATRPASSR